MGPVVLIVPVLGRPQKEGRTVVTRSQVAAAGVNKAHLLGAELGTRIASRTSVAAATWLAVATESKLRRMLEGYRSWAGGLLGLASEREVAQLRELVRALEYRVERAEEATRPTRPGS